MVHLLNTNWGKQIPQWEQTCQITIFFLLSIWHTNEDLLDFKAGAVPPPSTLLCFQCGFPGLWGLVKERSNIIYIYVLMHETDTFTSQGHWELISRWLESGGKGKPLPKHSMLFFPLNPQPKMKTTRDGVVGHVCTAQGLGEARLQPQRSPAAAG